MAESVKRRVAAARLAVAFVAAGTIAGATAWASAGPPPPTAQSSAKGEHIKKAILTVRSSANVANGSLLFEDFHKNEVPSFAQFKKLKAATGQHIKKATLRKYYPKVEIDRLFIKGESSDYIKRGEISSYLKSSEADARYHKLTDSLVSGDGSVHTATAAVGVQKVQLMKIPGMFTVDAEGPVVTITNDTGSALSHSACLDGQRQVVPAGSIAPGGSLECDISGGTAQTLQVVGAGAGGGPHVSTLNFSMLPAVQGGNPQVTVQILIGL